MSDSDEELSIPTIDLADLVHHEREVRARAARDVLEGFHRYGLVYVANHGVDFECRDRLFQRFYEFTERDEREKAKLSGTDIWFQRGWTPPNTEQAVVAGGQPDFKECYFAAPMPGDASCAVQYPEIFAANRWPDNLEGFADDYVNLGYQLHEAGLSLLSGCALALGLPERVFDHRLDGGAHVFRLLRYIPLREEQLGQNILWGEEHTDFNLMTVLAGGRFLDAQGSYCDAPDTDCGLYLRTRPTQAHPEGRIVRGKPPEGCIVMQVGQQLEILTGGQLQATPHVVTPPKQAGFSRISGAHFLHLHPHKLVIPFERFRNDENMRAYSPPVLAGTYALKTLVDIGLAPADALNSLGYRHYGRLAEIRANESP